MIDPLDITIEEAIRIPQPAGLKISRGYRLLAPVVNPPQLGRVSNTQAYWKFGVRREIFNWLKDQVGQHSSYTEWETRESNEGWWLHTGSQYKSNKGHESKLYLLNFWFNDRDTALMFKLIWGGKF